MHTANEQRTASSIRDQVFVNKIFLSMKETKSINMYVKHPQIYASLLDSYHRKQIYSHISIKAIKDNKEKRRLQRTIKRFDR